jgi:hypothetical protein
MEKLEAILERGDTTDFPDDAEQRSLDRAARWR